LIVLLRSSLIKKKGQLFFLLKENMQNKIIFIFENVD